MKDNQKVLLLEEEIEDLSIQLADMLGVALFFAGVPKDKIRSAVEAYLQGIDDVYGEEDGEMGFTHIVSVIRYLQDKKPELFKA